MEALNVLAKRFHIPGRLLRAAQQAPTHAMLAAQPADGRFPVLLHPTGLSGFRNASLFWIEELVSHGYVVVGMDQPGTAAATVFPDGRVVPLMTDLVAFQRYMPLALAHTDNQVPEMHGLRLPGGIIPFLAEDLRFVLTQLEELDQHDPMLADHLDTQHVGVFGMSLGGYIASEACRQDARFQACLVADAGQTMAVVQRGLDQPVMIMSRDAAIMRQERARAGGWPEDEITHTLTDQRALFEKSRGGAYYLTMNTMYHVNWTDAPLWSPALAWVGLAGPIDAYQGFTIVNAYTCAFFDHSLKGLPAPLLDELSRWQDVRLERRP